VRGRGVSPRRYISGASPKFLLVFLAPVFRVLLSGDSVESVNVEEVTPHNGHKTARLLIRALWK
jgi:hypothetical protein